MQIQEAFQVDFYQALCDADTDQHSNRKRLQKSLQRTLDFLDNTVDIHLKSEVIIAVKRLTHRTQVINTIT